MKNKFLFELGTEEIPADAIAGALEQMRRNFEKLLQENQIVCKSVKTYCTPRRLAIVLKGLPERQPDRQEVVVGPPRSAALEGEARPTKAGEGFARKLGVPFSALTFVDRERGEYLAYRKKIKGKPVAEILRTALPQIIASISWPKSMYWRASRFRFVRPLRWYAALWNKKKLPFEFEGVRAGNVTCGHRFLGKRKIRLEDSDAYLDKLRENYVLADVEQRRAKILEEVKQQLPVGLQVRADSELLETVVHLSEYPCVARGSFDPKFLAIPQEILVTVMRHHQKYFTVLNSNGKIRPYFLTVLNTDGDPDGRIRQGHERVLKARLEDAAFFWQADLKVPLKDRAGRLGDILFQEKLGSYRDKSDRVRALCRELGGDSQLDTAASLCKADLGTEVVRELPELQGIMGGLYARQEGYPEEIWKAIHEHYRPVSLEDESPSTRNGALLSISDKLDTVVACFCVGILPSGSSDPFALRRQAQGLVKVLFDHQFDFPLDQLVDAAQKSFSLDQSTQQTRRKILEFLEGRVRFIFQHKGIPYDVLNAVLAIGVEAVYPAYEKALALVSLKGEADFEAVAAAYKRIKNILAEQTIQLPSVSEKDLEKGAETDFYRAFQEVESKVERDVREQDYMAALKRIAGLRNTVDRFFDEVLVMTKEKKLRENRLRLLHEASLLFLRIADISEVVTKTGE